MARPEIQFLTSSLRRGLLHYTTFNTAWYKWIYQSAVHLWSLSWGWKNSTMMCYQIDSTSYPRPYSIFCCHGRTLFVQAQPAIMAKFSFNNVSFSNPGHETTCVELHMVADTTSLNIQKANIHYKVWGMSGTHVLQIDTEQEYMYCKIIEVNFYNLSKLIFIWSCIIHSTVHVCLIFNCLWHLHNSKLLL